MPRTDGHAVTDQSGNKDNTHGCHDFDAVTKIGDGVYSGQKGGYLVTSQSSIYFETNGISFAIAWNSHTTKPGGPKNEQWYPNFQPVLDAARKHDWGKTDLFPMYGMPALADVEINRSVIGPCLPWRWTAHWLRRAEGNRNRDRQTYARASNRSCRNISSSTLVRRG
jgi:hypothetical protein